MDGEIRWWTLLYAGQWIRWHAVLICSPEPNADLQKLADRCIGGDGEALPGIRCCHTENPWHWPHLLGAGANSKADLLWRIQGLPAAGIA